MKLPSSNDSLVLVSREGNDLYQTLKSNGIACQRYAQAGEALARVEEGGAILWLADDYPTTPTAIDEEWLCQAARRGLRVYLEFPASLPGLDALPVRRAGRFERGVVVSDRFGEGLPRGSIVTVPGCHLASVATAGVEPLLVLGKVAGFNQIAYGLEMAEIEPLLFHLPGSEILVATTALSHFLRGRFAPVNAWRKVFSSMLHWLSRGRHPAELAWRPAASPSFPKVGALPANAEDDSIFRAIDWFYRARLLLPTGSEAAYREEKENSLPAVADWPEGDGSEGVLEGLTSTMDHEGKQLVRWWRRADCTGEVAGAMAVAAVAEGNGKWRETAFRLADWLYCKSILSRGDRADPSHPAYGLLGWHDRAAHGPYLDGWGVYYGDDNARALLGTIAAAGALGTGRWDRNIARSILANLRTTGKEGFRADRINTDPLVRLGWKGYFEGSLVSYSPHFQAYLWACYLWTYSHTGDGLLLERTLHAIRATMEAYPNRWHWTNGIAQERARMILPLAWLIRVQDTEEHRAWLDFMVNELLAHQAESGAIYEQIGEGAGKYGPPRSHADYGKTEAPLLQRNGDPVADLLYTMNFAILGLHEAAASTGRKSYRDAEERMADFLLRVQVRSSRADLDGAWFRAFDFERWDHWGSDSDGDWGAWCAETGWTQGWIALVLAMRKLGTSLWKLGEESRVGEFYPSERLRMFGESSAG